MRLLTLTNLSSYHVKSVSFIAIDYLVSTLKKRGLEYTQVAQITFRYRMASISLFAISLTSFEISTGFLYT